MTYSSGFHMPGTFHADGVHPGLFRPPVSPSSSSGYLSSHAVRPPPPQHQQLQPSALEATPKRKRARGDLVPRTQEPDFAESGGHGSDPFLDTPGASRLGLETRTYALAGQLDTPNGGIADSAMLGESMYSDSDYRRALGSKRPREEPDRDSCSAPGFTPLFNLPDQQQPPSPNSRGWGTAAFSTLGGVVGKVWEFCKTGAFKGFYAGGGRGFEMTPSGGIAEDPSSMMWRDPAGDEYDCYEQRVPGRFPQGDQGYYQEEIREYQAEVREPFSGSGASTPSGPAAKRRQTEMTDDLGRNWVMITEPPTGSEKRIPRRPPGHRPSPRNRNQGPAVTTGRRIATAGARAASTTPGSTPRRNSSRFVAANAASPAPMNHPRPASSASFASPRSLSPTKLAPRGTSFTPSAAFSPAPPTTSHSSSQPTRTSRRRSSTNPPTSSYPPGHRRANSAASAASSRGNADDVDASPRLNAEARHLAARRKMEERDADVRIAAFNKRLQDMIRQGKEALGTTIEVDGGEGADGPWEDEGEE